MPTILIVIETGYHIINGHTVCFPILCEAKNAIRMHCDPKLFKRRELSSVERQTYNFT